MPQRLGITLFFCFTLISLLASRANATLHAENHHKRLLRKRMPQVLSFLGPSATGTTAPTPAQVSPSTPAIPITTPTEGVSTTASQTSSDSSSSTSNTDSTSSSSSALSSSTSASSRISSTPTPTVASTPPNLGNAGAAGAASTSLPGLQTQTETVGSASPSPSSSAQTQSTPSTSQQKVTLTVIVVIASSVGGIAILWTVFRKWKLGRSSRFDERLQPIDWEPPSEDKRRRPVSNASSFHSGAHDLGSEHGHEHGQSNIAPVPEHDFTALPASRFGGYADLARGPSPQPPPQMLETYNHSPVAGYDVNVPLHHQAGYGGGDYTNYNNAPMRY